MTLKQRTQEWELSSKWGESLTGAPRVCHAPKVGASYQALVVDLLRIDSVYAECVMRQKDGLTASLLRMFPCRLVWLHLPTEGAAHQ